jgi:hypothetical protein
MSLKALQAVNLALVEVVENAVSARSA